jgi:site-specific DNA-adenine methylase
VKPFFSYYGGKWRATPHYPAPEYATVIEPFAGSAGYSVRHEPKHALLIDAYEPIVATWQYLINASEQEILELPDLKPEQPVTDFGLPDGARYLIGFWLQRGTTAPGVTHGAWSRSIGGDNGWTNGGQLGWGAKARERIASQLHKIRDWEVVLGDYTCCLNLEATWFVDPPYQHQDRKYSVKFDDYEGLAAFCRSRQGQVIACDQEGAGWLPFEPLREVQATHGPQKKTKTTKEVVWTARPQTSTNSSPTRS